MTSQVITLNRLGVAVASDSISTITDMNDNYIASVQNTQKVFDLGPKHKLLIVNSDNMSISGSPISTLLSAWANTLEDAKPKVWDYLESFLDWLESQPQEHFPDMPIEFRNFIYDQLRPISESMEKVFPTFRPFAETTLEVIANSPEFARSYRRTLAIKVNAFLKQIESNRAQVFIDQDLPGNLQEAAQKTACMLLDTDAIVDLWFPDETIPKATKKRLKTNIYKLINHVPVQQVESLCRLSFVGYGSEEIFPKLFEVGIQSKQYGIVRWRGLGSAEVETNKRSEIYLMAQTSAIMNFLDGVHPKFLADIKASIPLAVVEDRQADFEDPSEFSEDEREVWLGIGDSVTNKLEKYIHGFKEKNRSGIADRLDFMGTSELAHMAKSLLALEILATLKDSGPSTVGGEIVSATIDHKNGVAWL